MAIEKVQVAAGGSLYEGWKTVRISAGMRQAYPEFELTVSEVTSDSAFMWPLLPGTPVQVLGTGSLIIDGFVDKYRPTGSPESHDVTVTGASRTVDFVESGIVHPTGTFEKKTAMQIVQELAAPFGLSILTDGPIGGIIDLFQIRQGSTPWAESIRLLQGLGLTLRGNFDGSLSISDGRPVGRHSGGLIQGENILQMSALLSGDARFSETQVIGQAADGDDDAALRPLGLAVDPGVLRFRPKVVIDQAATTPGRAQERALHEVRQSFVLSTQADITVSGWRDVGGQLWTPGRDVFVHAPWLHIEQDMTIDQVVFSQDDRNGTVTTLSLVDSGAEASGSYDVWRFRGFDVSGRRGPTTDEH